MLLDFILQHRDTILERSKAKLQGRHVTTTPRELEESSPLFLDQLCDALRVAATKGTVDHTAIGRAATRRGEEFQKLGLTVGQVVHGYGDVCQTITEVAVEQGDAGITAEDFQTLNLCLDDAIAAAVTGFSERREAAVDLRQAERLAGVATRLRDLVATAMISFDSIASGRVGAGGSTGMLHAQTLIALRNVVDSSLADLRLESGEAHPVPVTVIEFLEEIEAGAMVQSTAFAVPLVLRPPADRTLTIVADRQILAAALANLLQNAFQCSRKTSVTLSTLATAERVRFEIEDRCGGLKPETVDEINRAFEHGGPFGQDTGLSTAWRAAAANAGVIRMRNNPGDGTVYVVDLPRVAPARRS